MAFSLQLKQWFGLLFLLLAVLAGCGGVALPPQSLAVTSAAASDYKPIVQQLYIAYFGRPADTGGLANFEPQLATLGGSVDIHGLGQAYRNNAGLRVLIDSFGVSAESAALYSGDNSFSARQMGDGRWFGKSLICAACAPSPSCTRPSRTFTPSRNLSIRWTPFSRLLEKVGGAQPSSSFRQSGFI